MLVARALLGLSLSRPASGVAIITGSGERDCWLMVGLLPDLLAAPLARLEPYGMLILIGLLFIVPILGAQMGVDLSIASRGVGVVTETIISAIVWITGNS